MIAYLYGALCGYVFGYIMGMIIESMDRKAKERDSKLD